MSLIPEGPITVDEFARLRPELPEAGQWAELTQGKVEVFEAPDTDHGLVVSHLTKKLAGLATVGTPVFRPSLRLTQSPDTIRVPAIAYYGEVGRFDLLDATAIDEAPAWVIEIASTGDRRRAVTERVLSYRAWGIPLVWVIDPRERQLIVVDESTQSQASEGAEVSPEPIAPLRFPLSDLFVEPEWWTAKPS